MAVEQVALKEAQVRLLDLVDAAIKGQAVFITRDNQKIVQLVPIELPRQRPRFGSAKGLITMADDFDAPLADFDEYTP
jgi:antitoxin (DNA-binding transcriptional repressor) of toxin-antitoxin stability system